jgi:hypothetical protein
MRSDDLAKPIDHLAKPIEVDLDVLERHGNDRGVHRARGRRVRRHDVRHTTGRDSRMCHEGRADHARQEWGQVPEGTTADQLEPTGGPRPERQQRHGRRSRGGRRHRQSRGARTERRLRGVARRSYGVGTVSVAVPAGDYIAQGGCIASQVNGTINGSAEADLTANSDPNHFDTQVSTVPFTGHKFSFSKFGRATLSTHTGFHLPNGGTISEKCGDEEGSEVTNMSYNNVQVTAVQVGTLHG